MSLVNTTLNIRLLGSIYFNITRVLNELHFVMQESFLVSLLGHRTRRHQYM